MSHIVLCADNRTLDWSGADVMITDPPYRPHVHEAAMSHSQVRGPRHRDLGFAPVTPEQRDWLASVAATTKRWSVIFSDVESVGLWKDSLERAGAQYIRTIPWVRWTMPQLSGDRPPQGFEAIVLAHNASGKKHWNGLGNLTHCAHLALRGEGKHKTEKPLDLMLDLVSWFSDLGETVADPFCGSGTTGKACQFLERQFIGSEIDPEWAAKSETRLAEHPYSVRDQERVGRWHETLAEAEKARERIRKNTSKVRAKVKDAKETNDQATDASGGGTVEVSNEGAAGLGD